MQHEKIVQGGTMPSLDRIRSEYHHLVHSQTFSLAALFSPEDFRFNEFCRSFSAYPQSDELLEVTEIFGKQFGVWQAHTRYFINCGFLLYPFAHPGRLLTILKNLTVGFYLNDVMGRDVFQFLPPQQQRESRNLITKMVHLDENIPLSRYDNPIETANTLVMREFRDASPEAWYRKFKYLYNHHLHITHRDCNTDAVGHVPKVDAYVERRCHLAGMRHIVLWVEFSDGRFLDWDLLKEYRLARKMERLHWLSAAFGALSNDLFSFEKEVIDNGSDSNLVAIIALNNPFLSLKDAIGRSSELVRDLMAELIALLATMETEIDRLTLKDHALAEDLSIHLKGIVRFIQASWLWQLHAKRYKRQLSIWNETTLAKEAVA
jgi:terpene synthase-like protein